MVVKIFNSDHSSHVDRSIASPAKIAKGPTMYNSLRRHGRSYSTFVVAVALFLLMEHAHSNDQPASRVALDGGLQV